MRKSALFLLLVGFVTGCGSDSNPSAPLLKKTELVAE